MVFDIHIMVLYLFSAIAIFFFAWGIIEGRKDKNVMGIIISLIGGILWISVWALSDNIEIGYGAIDYTLDYSMNVTTGTSSSALNSVNNFAVAERPANTASVLYLKPISCITVDMARQGTPPAQTATIGILGDNNQIVKSFGTIEVSTMVTSQKRYAFCLPNHDYWIISSFDKIGVFYNGGSSGNGLLAYHDATDVFDSTNSVRATLNTAGTWTDVPTTDQRMILTFDNSNIDTNYSLGDKDNANGYIRIYMLTFGVIMIFVGAFQGRLGN